MKVQRYRKAEWIPAGFDRPTLVDEFGIPYPFAAVWSDNIAAKMSVDQVQRHLSSIGFLYEVADELTGRGSLDVAIASYKLVEIEAIVQSLVARLANGNAGWERRPSLNHITRFLSDIFKYGGHPEGLDPILRFIRRLKALYGNLAVEGKRPPPPLRALPATVIEDLIVVFAPDSERNPFRTDALRWRNYMIFMFLLMLGLRRSELAGILISSFSERFDSRLGKRVRWVTITTSDEYDPRYEAPGIKTPSSHRQLPVPDQLAQVTEFYQTNFRGKANFPYLAISQKGQPMSVRQISDVMACATAALSPDARLELRAAGLTGVSCHDLRHTCAVFQLQKYRDSSIEIEEAEKRLRRFFGWKDGSEMPRLYGRAYFEPRAHEVYEQTLELTRDILGRAYPRTAHG